MINNGLVHEDLSVGPFLNLLIAFSTEKYLSVNETSEKAGD